MPRPIRIEYENAFYHVMNRGRGRKTIFHTAAYYHAFIDTLSEASERFGVIVHGYCLMNNHYHLLLQTPHANLGRVMRHVNGVYTQRHNRLKNTDGPLFRGRYKAILVEHDAYLLTLSRYIHRNPIETKLPLVKKLEQYKWSSYPAYINKVNAPSWLHRETLYDMLGQHQKYQGYRAYIDQGNDEEIKQFYTKTNLASVMGNQQFIDWLKEEVIPECDDGVLLNKVLMLNLSIKKLTAIIAVFYQLKPKDLTQVIRGPAKGLLARKTAMYLCQQVGGFPLEDIKVQFGLLNIGSVSFITSQVRHSIKTDSQFEKQIQSLKTYIVKNAT